MRWELLKGHEGKKVTIEVNGLMVDAVVSIQWTHEDCHPEIGHDFDFGSDKANRAYLKRFERGELDNIVISVIARAEGLEGIDTLGGCHVGSIDDTLSLVDDHGMRENALSDLKTAIVEAATRLQKYAKGA